MTSGSRQQLSPCADCSVVRKGNGDGRGWLWRRALEKSRRGVLGTAQTLTVLILSSLKRNLFVSISNTGSSVLVFSRLTRLALHEPGCPRKSLGIVKVSGGAGASPLGQWSLWRVWQSQSQFIFPFAPLVHCHPDGDVPYGGSCFSAGRGFLPDSRFLPSHLTNALIGLMLLTLPSG